MTEVANEIQILRNEAEKAMQQHHEAEEALRDQLH